MTLNPVFFYRGSAREPTEAMVAASAGELGCTVAALKAVIAVEASGDYYNPDGTFIRRFEPHHLPADFQKMVGFSGNWRTSFGLSKSERARMFKKAYDRDPATAVYAASWGAFQIMGFNAKRAGYASALDMVTSFERDVSEQLRAFVNFVQFIGADKDLRSQDWLRFATKYNGSGQAAVYAKKIETAYAKYTNGGGSMQVLRMGARGASVSELQRALASLGYFVEVDGVFGAETLEAVRTFQHDEVLPVDGVVGAVTWAALRSKDTKGQLSSKHDPHYAPAPETKTSAGENTMDKITAVSGGLSALTGVLTTLLGDNPSDTVRVALIGAVGLLGVIALGSYLYRRHHNSNRALSMNRELL